MRSDRLPLSTFDFQPKPGVDSYRPLHANPGFEVYLFDDQGGVGSVQSFSSGIPSNGDDDDNEGIKSTLQCGNLIPLECYYYETDSNGNQVLNYHPKGHSCWTGPRNKVIMNKINLTLKIACCKNNL